MRYWLREFGYAVDVALRSVVVYTASVLFLLEMFGVAVSWLLASFVALGVGVVAVCYELSALRELGAFLRTFRALMAQHRAERDEKGRAA